MGDRIGRVYESHAVRLWHAAGPCWFMLFRLLLDVAGECDECRVLVEGDVQI